MSIQSKNLNDAFETIETPGLIFDENLLNEKLQILSRIATSQSFKLLFPLKSMALQTILRIIAKTSSGFAVSSPFEARLARDLLPTGGLVHYTSPGLESSHIQDLLENCDIVTFNSLTQLNRFHDRFSVKCRLGIRINPELSYVEDARYDPSGKHSKLGIPISKLINLSEHERDLLKLVSGLLLHTNCESENFGELYETVELIDQSLPQILENIEWINLGGGYLFDKETDFSGLINSVELLQEKYGLDVIFEPGKGIVGRAGFLVASVVDIFDSSGKQVAVLNTSVNHVPEAFEYQWSPPVSQSVPEGSYSYILAGASCLAGDIFGEYSFAEPLDIGAKIVFEDMGAYTLVKAHMFNGINLPSVYLLDKRGQLEKIKEFNYMDFQSKCGEINNDFVRKSSYDIETNK